MKHYVMVLAYASQYMDNEPTVFPYCVDITKKEYDKLKDKVGTVITDHKVAEELLGNTIHAMNLAFDYPLSGHKNNRKENVRIVSVTEFEWSV